MNVAVGGLLRQSVIFGVPMPARSKVPRHLRDSSLWPTPDRLEERALASTAYLQRKKAVDMSLSGSRYPEILAETGIEERSVRRLVGRCITINPATGEIFGFHACREGFRLRPYTRTAPFTSQGQQAGTSGMLDLTLRAFPEVAATLLSEALHLDEENQQYKIPTRELLAVFQDDLKVAMKEAGLDWETQWPFTQQDGGYESVRRWRERLRDSHTIHYVRAHYGVKAADKLEAGTHKPSLFENFRALAVRQLDFHEVDTACILVFRDPNGNEFERPVERFYLGAIVTEHPVMLAGYVLVFAPSPDADDVLDLVQGSVFPEKREGPVSTLLANGKVVMAGLIDKLFGSGFAALLMDNAAYNLTIGAIGPIMDAIACMIVFGVPRKWWSRGLIEKFFAVFEGKTGQKLPTTYGKSPVDPMRGNPTEAAKRLRIYVDDILETFEEFAEQINTRSVSRAAFGQTAVKAVQGMLETKHLGVFPQPLPATPSEPGWTFFAQVIECKVRGSEKKGERCHVNMDSRRYTSPNLGLRFDLVGKTVVACRHRWNDNLVVAIVKETGQFLGYLLPDRRARRNPMHPRLAKIVNRHYRREYFRSGEKSPGRKLLERKVAAARNDPQGKESRQALDVLRLAQRAEQAARVAGLSPRESANSDLPAPIVGSGELPTALERAPLFDDVRTKIKIPLLSRLRRNGRR
ncbi:hypothetical protein C2L65_36600 [Paraburkholderia terrae]|uniref:Integrase catalytic domain-containing protein n=2 Tax=Paraburkholderia terrae TaxID=311230 RepID=A0A2I8F052_9BURK|nr:hypothetical protein C2L65_36600 [Paraburkholderia terrae]